MSNDHTIEIDLPIGPPIEVAGVNVRGIKFPIETPQRIAGGSRVRVKFIGDDAGMVVRALIEEVTGPDYDALILQMRHNRKVRNWDGPGPTKKERRQAEAPQRAARKAERDRAIALGSALSVATLHDQPMRVRLMPYRGKAA